ncbi:2-aminooxy adenylosuccinate synthetase [Vibrio phage K225]|nr:putative adenylosuccinate synthase [Vibrio phage 23E28.1]QZI92065.1 putative adenylosuccinate synthase [Vibrio phage 69E27.1]
MKSARQGLKIVDLVIDLQFGSTGKGLIAGYLAEKNGYDTVINANMPNAGHTYINADGRKWMHKVIPNGIVSPNLKRVMIGPNSVFSIDQFLKEYNDSIDLLENVAVLIHPMAAVLDSAHKEAETSISVSIGSTGQGSMAALVEKMGRNPENQSIVARDVAKYDSRITDFVCTVDEWECALMASQNILAEGAQGFSLSLNQEFYPYCTSRDCTPARFLADMGIPHVMLRKVIGTARCHPIRVGGTSGGHYADQMELSWEDVGQTPELTTVTKKVRRIFSFSFIQMQKAMWNCQPDEVFLNFCNYLEPAAVEDIIMQIEHAATSRYCDAQVKYLGWGAQQDNIEEREVQEIDG